VSASVPAEATRRLYAVDSTPLREVVDWVERYRRHWEEHFDALDARLAAMRGKPTRSRGSPRRRKQVRKGK
jgi:hypothetical protein